MGVGVVLVVGFSFYNLIASKNNNTRFYPILYTYAASFTFLVLHYFLAKKYKLAANYFSAV